MQFIKFNSPLKFFLSSLHFTHSLYKSKVAVRWMYKSRNRQTVERFVRLVNDYAKTEHEIEFYASQLCMTAHYLGMVVKKETGITAKEYRMMPEDTPCSSIEASPPPINNCKLLIYNMLFDSRYPFLNETSRSSKIFLSIYTSFRPFFSWGHSGSRSKWIEAGVLSA